MGLAVAGDYESAGEYGGMSDEWHTPQHLLDAAKAKLEPTDDDKIFAAIRKANGPGRVEWLFDPDRSVRADQREGIGYCLLNPEYHRRIRATADGNVVAHDGHRYRVRVVKALVGSRDKDGRIVQGYFVDPAPLAIVPLVPFPDKRDLDAIEVRARYYDALRFSR